MSTRTFIASLLISLSACGTASDDVAAPTCYTTVPAPAPAATATCLPCSEVLPGVNCVPSLCRKTAVGFCCVQ